MNLITNYNIGFIAFLAIIESPMKVTIASGISTKLKKRNN